jgi:hypothetical protein
MQLAKTLKQEIEPVGYVLWLNEARNFTQLKTRGSSTARALAAQERLVDATLGPPAMGSTAAAATTWWSWPAEQTGSARDHPRALKMLEHALCAKQRPQPPAPPAELALIFYVKGACYGAWGGSRKRWFSSRRRCTSAHPKTLVRIGTPRRCHVGKWGKYRGRVVTLKTLFSTRR